MKVHKIKKIFLVVLFLEFKIAFAQNAAHMDTLIVSQNDTTVFEKRETVNYQPCSRPRLYTYFELKNPKDGTYYFIHNEKDQLVKEGKYTSTYMYEGRKYEQGNFYNSKTYTYKNNGHLATIHYQEDGRNVKTEFFDQEKRLEKIRYIDKKAEETTKLKFYKKGKLKETRIYSSFDTYYTIKAKE
ncbi:hypothetical protein LZQ00_03010 [Sphingobacterium sp. SRCM116780]|uniref:hypothetical protein n=1 Tax=Sphingobacterium sp. SRCM116780 TaxID=2907623 RepID=UPI001F22FE91|nr:hypothetical protein [Sphingobacterium sp. SRCM116780]UIR56794.1 hypothetical protein LZQ00_03010 [Sphingobacterium sp. SRCM116780]